MILAGCGSGGGSSSPAPSVPSTLSQFTPPSSASFGLPTLNQLTSPSPAPHITDSGSVEGFFYFLSSVPEPGRNRGLLAHFTGGEYTSLVSGSFNHPKGIDVVYLNDNGFKGIYSLNGKTGEIISDVRIEMEFTPYGSGFLDGWIGQRKNIVMNGYNFGELTFSDILTETGGFEDRYIFFSGDGVYSPDGKITGRLSTDGTSAEAPGRVFGAVEIYGFSNNWRDNEPTRRDNSLVGVFVGETNQARDLDSPQSKPPVPSTQPSPGGSRDTSIKYLFQAALNENPGSEPYLVEALLPWYDLNDKRGLIRVNPSSIAWYANPQASLPNGSQFGFNVERPHKGRGWVYMNADDVNKHLLEGTQYLKDNTDLSNEELASGLFTWIYRLNEAAYTGYNQWLRHLDYDPGELTIRIGPTDGIAHYDSYNNWVMLDEDWLLEAYYYYSVGDTEQWNAVLDQLTWVITHEAAHQFGYNNSDGTTDGCETTRCHAPYGSGSVVSYDAHLGLSTNYGVTEEDVKHIPNATYNDSPYSDYRVSKDSPMGEYGVWITHYFEVTGKTIPGATFGGDYAVSDSISSYGFVTDSDLWDDQLPSGSATYSGEDNFVGADMSAHYLGALLRADANLVYQFGSTASGNMSLTIDDFEVYNGDIWRNQSGSITYRLSCESDGYCGTEDGYTVDSWFGLDGQYVGGQLEDIDNEYVGAFVAEKEINFNPAGAFFFLLEKGRSDSCHGHYFCESKSVLGTTLNCLSLCFDSHVCFQDLSFRLFDSCPLGCG